MRPGSRWPIWLLRALVLISIAALIAIGNVVGPVVVGGWWLLVELRRRRRDSGAAGGQQLGRGYACACELGRCDTRQAAV